ncbi:MAG: peptidoglycan DD-metalloendopeptidase family protein [Propionibacteriaceae bacterium]|nr:peptidoglycan DD-metalloendopeptidase family protein [Propionibacteriaceae bacterium]
MTSRWTRIAVAVCTIAGLSVFTGTAPADADNTTGMSMADIRAQLDDLQQQQQDLVIQQAESRDRLSAAQTQVEATRTEIADQKARMSGLESQIGQIALQQYQDRGLNATAMIISSTSSDDLLNYITAMQQVSDTANSLFSSLQIQQGTLADLERSQQAAIAQITAEQSTLASLNTDITAKIAKAATMLDAMTATAAAQNSSLAGPNAVGAGVADPTKVVPNPSPALASPLDSYKITSDFGMRIHPITGAYQFHDGIDMGAACGKPVIAPGNGFVMDYYWAGGYGNRMVVDNGMIGGHHIVTSYNHLSGGVAKPGTSVVQGQVIALVGTTGTSTGCHLHYMVWSDGQIVNPADYL